MKKILFFFICISHFMFSFAQDFTISGVVIADEDNLPLPGANVSVKGSTRGTMTDVDGKFSIKAAKGATIQISFVGYQTYNKTVSGNANWKVTLTSDSQMLDEVIAVGYGTVKKNDLTGAVASVSGEKLTKIPVAGAAQALQGLVAGVTVVSNSGQPGTSAAVQIRGIGTIGNSGPVYVVDGVICENIDFLSTNDIKSTEILKDASSAAIYGARGANGVIIITTKQGVKGEKISLTVEASYGIQNRVKKLDMMNSDQLSRFWGYDPAKSGFNDWIYANFAGTKDYIPAGLDYSSYETDWQDLVFEKNAPVQNYHIAANGATEKASYSVSANYFDQKGIIMESFYRRFTFRVNTNLKINNWLRIGENLSVMTSANRDAPNNSDNYSLLNSAIRLAPWDPQRFPDGQVSASTIANYANPLSMTEFVHPTSNWDRMVGNAFLEIEPVKGLVYKADFGVDLSYGRSSTFKDQYEIAPYDLHKKSFIQRGMERYMAWNIDNTLTYKKTFKENHNFSAMVGLTFYESQYYKIGGSRDNVKNPKPENWYLIMADGDYTVNDAAGRSAMASFIGRITYDYANRYFMTFNYRCDGSSNFPRKNLYGNFPSASVAWKISEEAFFEPARTVMDILKLRVGWGQLGNQTIDPDNFYPKVQTGSQFVSYVFGTGQQALAYGGSMISLPTEGLMWETTEQTNVGLDFAFLNNRISGTMDYYVKDTKDMLLSVALPGHIGMMYSSPDNVGQVRNQGFEFSADYRDRVGKVNYSIGGNFATVKNEFTKIGNSAPIYTDGFKGESLIISTLGEPLYSFYGYTFDGIFQNQAEVDDYVKKDANGNPELDANGETIPIISGVKPGDVRYIDVNADGTINDADKKILGKSFPSITYAFNVSLDWNNFDLQLFFQGVAGNKIYNCNRVLLEGGEGGKITNLGTQMFNSWNGENSTNTMPRAYGKASNYWASDRFLESGNYLRLKNAQIGYTLPKKLTSKIGVEKCRFYVSGSNLFTFTKYTGYDPEAGLRGVDRGNYPQARTFLVGLTLNL